MRHGYTLQELLIAVVVAFVAVVQVGLVVLIVAALWKYLQG